jgi:propanediol utilization protein
MRNDVTVTICYLVSNGNNVTVTVCGNDARLCLQTVFISLDNLVVEKMKFFGDETVN